jgi:predicted transcriptional regulator of viral defense system
MARETVSARDIGGSRRFRVGIDVLVGNLAEGQHGVVARRQLLALGVGEDAVQHRLAIGRLYPVGHGVYAVGHRALSPKARWMAGVLSSGSGAVLSHRTAATLWGICDTASGPVDVTVSRKSKSSRFVRRHHSVLPDDEVTTHDGIPVTTVPRTVLDFATASSIDQVERAIRQAEYLHLYD